MGGRSSKFSGGLTHDELMELKRTFRTLAEHKAPHRTIDRATFLSYFPLEGRLGEEMFAAFDTDHSQGLDLQQFLAGVTLLRAGTPDEKIAFLFEVFNFEHDEGVSRPELRIILWATLHSLLQLGMAIAPDATVDLPTELPELAPETVGAICDQLVLDAFDRFDEDHSGKLSVDQFQKWARERPFIADAICSLGDAGAATSSSSSSVAIASVGDPPQLGRSASPVYSSPFLLKSPARRAAASAGNGLSSSLPTSAATFSAVGGGESAASLGPVAGAMAAAAAATTAAPPRQVVVGFHEKAGSPRPMASSSPPNLSSSPPAPFSLAPAFAASSHHHLHGWLTRPKRMTRKYFRHVSLGAAATIRSYFVLEGPFLYVCARPPTEGTVAAAAASADLAIFLASASITPLVDAGNAVTGASSNGDAAGRHTEPASDDTVALPPKSKPMAVGNPAAAAAAAAAHGELATSPPTDDGAGARFGFKLVYGGGSEEVDLFAESAAEREAWISALRAASKNRLIDDCYDVQYDHVLGTGQFSTVHPATPRLNDGNQSAAASKNNKKAPAAPSNTTVAVKVVNKAQLDDEELEQLRQEVSVLRLVSGACNNVLRLLDLFESPDRMVFVMERLGSDLLRVMEARAQKHGGRTLFAEAECKVVAYNLLSALRFIHSVGIVHRDVKCNNLAPRVTSAQHLAGPVATVTGCWVLIDFGYAALVGPKGGVEEPAGTPAYFAPELVKGEAYNTPIDLWAAGIILYRVATGQEPFDHRDDTGRLLALIRDARYECSKPCYTELPADLKDLLRRLLRRLPAERITAEDALQHAWLADMSSSSSSPAAPPTPATENGAAPPVTKSKAGRRVKSPAPPHHSHKKAHGKHKKK